MFVFVEGFLNECFIMVVCGFFYIVVVIEIGDVWVWGMEGGLGLCLNIGFFGLWSGDVVFFVWVFGESFGICNFVFGFKGIMCGVVYIVILFNGGKDIWVWGWG